MTSSPQGDALYSIGVNESYLEFNIIYYAIYKI